MKLSLPASVGSSQDVTALLLEVRNYSKWASHELIKQKVKAVQVSPQPEFSAACIELLQTWSGKEGMTQAAIDELIAALEAYKKSAPTITLTLAGLPPSSLKLKLVSWCRENIAPNVLVSFKMNRNILGGMVVSHGSHIFDWSFRRKLLNAQESIPEVLKRV